jgi:hypothetical protein
LSDGVGLILKQRSPLHLTPNHEVLVHEGHHDLSGMGVWVEARQQCLPRNGVILAAHQEAPKAHAVVFGIAAD